MGYASMSVRSWAVGVVSTAAVVAGVVVVQSGIPGTAPLPILPHRTVAPAPVVGGAELPAPAEVSAPPPGAEAVHEASVARAAVLPERRPAADRPEKRTRQSGEDSGDNSDQGSKHDRSGKGAGHDPDQDSHGGHGRD